MLKNVYLGLFLSIGVFLIIGIPSDLCSVDRIYSTVANSGFIIYSLNKSPTDRPTDRPTDLGLYFFYLKQESPTDRLRIYNLFLK